MRFYLFGPRFGWFRPGASFDLKRRHNSEPEATDYKPHWFSLIVTIPLALLLVAAAAALFSLALLVVYVVAQAVFFGG